MGVVVSRLVGRDGFETRPYAVRAHRRFESGAVPGLLLRGRPMQNARCRRPIVHSQGFVHLLRAALRLLASRSRRDGEGGSVGWRVCCGDGGFGGLVGRPPLLSPDPPLPNPFPRRRPLQNRIVAPPLVPVHPHPNPLPPSGRGDFTCPTASLLAFHPLKRRNDGVLQWSHGGERGFCPALPQWSDVPSAEAPASAGMTWLWRGNGGVFVDSGWTFRPLKRPRPRE